MHHGGLNMKHKTVSTIAAILCGGFLSFIPAFAQEGASSSTSKQERKILEKLEYDDFKDLIADETSVMEYRNNPEIANSVRMRLKIENENQYIRFIFNEYADKYSKSFPKARLPERDKILISFPDNMEKLFLPLTLSETNIARIGRFSVSLDYYSYYCFLKDDKGNTKCRVSMLLDKSAKSALARNIMYSSEKRSAAAMMFTWRNDEHVPFMEPPFDYTLNMPAKSRDKENHTVIYHLSLYASFCNVMIIIYSENHNGILDSIQFVPDRIIGLVHGHETAKEIRNVDWLDLAPETVKSDGSQKGTTFKAVCKFKDQHRNMRDKHWILAVADKGELSVEKAEFKALSREFRIKYKNTESVNKFFKDAREIPDTVFLSLPEGEKTAELTFYFISEDGKQYSSQSVTMTVPETPAPNKVD